MTADAKYSRHNTGNLSQQIQIHLSSASSPFSQYFTKYLESKTYFKHFEKKLSLIDLVFSQLFTTKNVVI